LRGYFPDAEITFIGLPWAADLIGRLPYIDRFVIFPGYEGIAEVPYQPERTQTFLADARAAGYDLAIQMHGNGTISNGFIADLGARVSLGYRRGGDSRLTLSLPYRPAEHEVLRWLRLVGSLSRSEMSGREGEIGEDQAPIDQLQSSTSLDFPIGEDEKVRAAQLLGVTVGAPTVGLHPGAKDPARRWPTKHFAALADALVDRYGATIVLTGGVDECELTAAIVQAMSYPALDLAGQTDLGLFGALISRLDLLVTNDSGPAHLAAATGTPSAVLFGPGRPDQWGPLDRQRHRVIDALALGGPGADPATALERLTVEPVQAVCEDILESAARRRQTADRDLLASEVGRPLSVGDPHYSKEQKC
jgi:ADP-heptose:LPS heptosyltransferase